ncbi:GTPase ObgE [soil metagenome]
MFIDEATISVKGGNGGNGTVAFFPGLKNGPSGGDGGNGGSVYVRGDKNLADLHRFTGATKYAAQNGSHGENFNRHGHRGEDLILRVPTGTLIKDIEQDFEIEVNDTETVQLLVRGGTGGRGNAHFATATEQSPRYAKPGREGQKRHLRLVQRLIADFGLIGLPNAGKSSLLNELTSAKVKTALYPFTTLEPNLGVFDEFVIADIPGLIEGAAHGKGLGIKFLKHVEKVPVLLHCIASDAENPVEIYNTIMNEMGKYNESLLKKPQVIILTKTDLIEEKDLKTKIRKMQKLQKTVIPVSIFNPIQFAVLQKMLRDYR